MKPFLVRFFEKVKTKPDKCWEWDGAVCGVGKHGQFYHDGKLELAHRVIYKMAYGRLPDSSIVMHNCDNPACVNPMHLRIGTHSDNTIDMMRKGRGRQQKVTCKIIRKIHKLYALGYGSTTIGRLIGLSESRVRYIKRNGNENAPRRISNKYKGVSK